MSRRKLTFGQNYKVVQTPTLRVQMKKGISSGVIQSLILWFTIVFCAFYFKSISFCYKFHSYAHACIRRTHSITCLIKLIAKYQIYTKNFWQFDTW